jgi:hypothetical protein
MKLSRSELTEPGNVYEKRLIEAYINENGTEPTTGAALSAEDLLEIRTQPNVIPRPPQMTSIPAMLSMFQNEWDSMALQVYKLQQDLKQARQELSVALYQHDGAVRVIAQVASERDEARKALANVSVGRAGPAGTNGDAMQVDSTALPAPILEKIDNEQQRYENWNLLFYLSNICNTDCQRPDGSDQSRKNGPPQSRFRHTYHCRLLKPCILGEQCWLSTSLEIWLLLEGGMQQPECFPFPRTDYCSR